MTASNFTGATGVLLVVMTTATTTPFASRERRGYRVGNFLIPFTPTFACSVAMVIGSVVLNSLLLAGLRRDSRLKAVTYNYVGSICSAMLLQALACFPPGVLQEVIGVGHHTLMNTLCIAWIYLDTFLCNLVFLHCLGSTIDTWLRLRYPMRYTYSTTRGSTCLKLGAPWSVGFIQTTAEFAISRQHEGLYHSSAGVCLHRDPNFVILRACMSYALPGVASLLMLGLGFCQFSAVRGQQDPELVSELIRSYNKQQQQQQQSTDYAASCSSINVASTNGDTGNSGSRGGAPGVGASSSCAILDITPTDEDGVNHRHLPRDCTRETLLLYSPGSVGAGPISRDATSAFELCRMTPIPEAPDENGGSGGICSVPPSRSCHTFKPGGSGSGTLLPSPRSYGLPPQLHPAVSNCPVHCATMQHIQHRQHHQQQYYPHQPYSPEDHQLSTEIPSSAFAYDDQPSVQHQQQQQPPEQQQRCQRRRKSRHNSWRRMLRSEKAACRLNLCAFLVSLVFWSPYTLSSLLHCVCVNFPCPPGLPPSPANIGDMKWIAYASAIAFPVFFLFADADVRRAAGRAATCKPANDSATTDDLVYGPRQDEGGEDDGDSCTLADSQA